MNIKSWHFLRVFLVVAETGSLSAAGKVLGSNQPTLGRQISQLEEELEVKLFHRHAKGFTLTDEGKLILKEAQVMQRAADKIKITLQGKEQKISGEVCLSLPEGMLNELLLPQLPHLLDRHPNLSLQLNVSSTAANLHRGESDIAIRLFRPKQESLIIKKLGDLPLGFFASVSYVASMELESQKGKSPQIITYGEQLSNQRENQILIHEFPHSVCRLRSDSYRLRTEATRMGMGISVMPIDFASRHSDLVQIFQSIPLTSYEVYLVYHQHLRDTPKIRVLIDLLAEFFISLQRGKIQKHEV